MFQRNADFPTYRPPTSRAGFDSLPGGRAAPLGVAAVADAGLGGLRDLTGVCDTSLFAGPRSPDWSLIDRLMAQPEAADLQHLMDGLRSSRAESSQSVLDYQEGDRAINADLRSYTGAPGRRFREGTRDFLRDLGEQSGSTLPAFRICRIRPELAKRLRQSRADDGEVFADYGVQSASGNYSNVKGWEPWARHGGGRGDETVVYVFDGSVPKRNIATGQVMDHLAVMPGQRLQVAGVRTMAGRLQVCLCGACTASAASPPPRSLYDGQPLVAYPGFADELAGSLSFRF